MRIGFVVNDVATELITDSLRLRATRTQVRAFDEAGGLRR